MNPSLAVKGACGDQDSADLQMFKARGNFHRKWALKESMIKG